MSEFKLVAPNGKPIVGTREVVLGTARVSSWTEEDGVLIPNYEDETEVDWDSQETVSDADWLEDSAGNAWSPAECLRATKRFEDADSGDVVGYAVRCEACGGLSRTDTAEAAFKRGAAHLSRGHPGSAFCRIVREPIRKAVPATEARDGG